MQMNFITGGKSFYFDSKNYSDISIPLQFNGEQPNIYGVDRATSKAYDADDFIGDTRKGGSCNFESYFLTPHCNGTHTECIGHISHHRFSIVEQLKDILIPATLITISTKKANERVMHNACQIDKGDEFVSRETLEEALSKSQAEFLKALIIRTAPNLLLKKSRNYSHNPAPYLLPEAMEFLVELGVDHLLVDLPSVDKSLDQGRMSSHRIFWNLEPESHQVQKESSVNKTITEMIFVPDEIRDGTYLLNLQIAPFVADATPSRPILYPLINK